MRWTQRLLPLALLALLPIQMSAQLQAQTPASAAQSTTAAEPSAGVEEAGRLNEELRRLNQAGRMAEALPLASRALQLAERTLGNDHPDTLLAAHNLGVLYRNLSRYAEAEPLYLRALEGSERVNGPEHLTTLSFATNLADLYYLQGRYAEVEPLFRRVLEARERVLDRDHPDTLGSINDLALLYADQGRYAEAEALTRRALSGYERANGPEHRNTLALLNNLALLHKDQGRFAEAEPLYLRAIAGNERARGGDHPDTLTSVHNLAGLYRAQGRYAEAEPLYRRALEGEERVRGRDHPDTLGFVRSLALLYEDAGRHADAEPLFRRVLEARQNVLGRSHPNTLSAAAGLLAARGAFQADAPGTLDIARQLLAGQRQRARLNDGNQQARAQRDREARTSSDRFALVADSMWGATAADRATRARMLPEAFGALQDSVAGSADRAIAEQAGRRYVAQGNAQLADVMRERQSLESEWSRLDAGLAAAFAAGPDAAGERSAALRTRVEAIQARIAAIDARLRAEAPQYFALISPTPLDIPAAQRLLRPDEAILLAVPGRFGTHVVAVTHDAIEWRRSDWNAERVRTAVQTLRRDLGPRPRRGANGGRAFDRATSHQLYRELVAPVSPLLVGRRRVYVAAGGSLAALPFSILVTAPPTGSDDDAGALRETKWLGDDIALVHIPSIRALALLRQAPRPEGERRSFFGVGNPVLRGDPAASPIDIGAPRGTDIFFQPGRTRDGGVLANITSLHQLRPLPGSAEELEAVRATLGAPASSLLLADRATEPNVRSADLSTTRILLFATHGLTVAEGAYFGAGESGLVLTPPVQARDGDDGFLAASEVTSLRLDADWVILSACNTATGDGVNSAGLGSLARAFFYAGARNLLASHWLVNDGVAPVLINRTLALERAGTARAEAFRQAMREVRMDASADSPTETLAHPYYWAPFVLIGDGGL